MEAADMRMSTIYHTGPVTALYIHNKSVLAGIGSSVHVYNVDSGCQSGQTEVLPGHVVHGIRTGRGDGNQAIFCVFGQKCMRVVHLDHMETSVKIASDMVEFSDWIWDVAWQKDDEKIHLALGHNVILTFDLKTLAVTRQIHCVEKCILYCAKFISCEANCVVLAAGSVFNQVVIWSPSCDPNTDGHMDVLHRLTGHQGVIFSVDYKASSRLICSVSDDRSIRLYQVKFPGGGAATGLSDWQAMESTVLHVLYGHAARVWDVRLLSSTLVSVGEDSTCCVWSYDGQVKQKFKGHKGKSIWSMAVDKGENFVVTGGGDHSIRLWNLKQQTDTTLHQVKCKALNFELEDKDFARNVTFFGPTRIIVSTDLGQIWLYDTVTCKGTCLMSDPSLVSYTTLAVSPASKILAIGNIHGNLRMVTTEDLYEVDNTELSFFDMKVCDGKVYSINWLDEETLVTTASDGNVSIWLLIDKKTTDLVSQFELPPSKHRWITAITWSCDHSHIVCGERSGSVFVYRLDPGEKICHLKQKFIKLHGKGGVTSVCCHGDEVYTTGRDGLYRMFTWTDENTLVLLNQNKVCKGFEWIERLSFTEGDLRILGFHTNLFVMWSVGQNQKLLEIECGGGHRAWDFCHHGDSTSFVYIKAREVLLHEMEMKSHQVLLKGCLHGRELCDAKFVQSIQSEKGGQQHLMVTCSEDTSVCLTLLQLDQGLPKFSVLHTLSGHISSVRCLAVCNSNAQGEGNQGNRKLIFSAGGRAQMKIWRVHCKARKSFGALASGSDTSLDANHDHESKESEKTVLTVGDSSKEGPAVGGCELNDNNVSSVECVYEGLAGIQLSEIGKRRKKPWRYPQENSDPETRFLDIAVVNVSEVCENLLSSVYIISAACSDGYVRILAFDEHCKEITSLASSDFHNHCVLKTQFTILYSASSSSNQCSLCSHVTAKNRPSHRLVALSAATDGIVAFWDITRICHDFSASTSQECDVREQNCYLNRGLEKKVAANANMTPFFTLNLHQSGINSLHFKEYEAGKYMLLSGGDDNALCVNKISMEMDKDKVIALVTSCGVEKSAHSAQITGASCLNPALVVTASIDQRVCLWGLREQTTGGIQLQMLGCKFVDVADIANMHVLTDSSGHYLLLCGDGLCVLKVDNTPTDQSEDKTDGATLIKDRITESTLHAV